MRSGTPTNVSAAVCATYPSVIFVGSTQPGSFEHVTNTMALHRGEGLIVQLRAEVAGMHVCDHLASVLGRPQVVPGAFVERHTFKTGNLDHAVQGRAEYRAVIAPAT